MEIPNWIKFQPSFHTELENQKKNLEKWMNMTTGIYYFGSLECKQCKINTEQNEGDMWLSYLANCIDLMLNYWNAIMLSTSNYLEFNNAVRQKLDHIMETYLITLTKNFDACTKWGKCINNYWSCGTSPYFTIMF